jgi:hypothetical protein
MDKIYTVGELIEHLKTFDAGLPVGAVGHFGEFHPMRKYQFYKKGATESIGSEEFIDVLCIDTPDIGSEPD